MEGGGVGGLMETEMLFLPRHLPTTATTRCLGLRRCLHLGANEDESQEGEGTAGVHRCRGTFFTRPHQPQPHPKPTRPTPASPQERRLLPP